MAAARVECAKIYADLFGAPLDSAVAAEWNEWLKAVHARDAAAGAAIKLLRNGLDAARSFYESNPSSRMESRAGLRAEYELRGDSTEIRIYIDPPSLPPLPAGVEASLRERLVPVDVRLIPSALIPAELTATLPLPIAGTRLDVEHGTPALAYRMVQSTTPLEMAMYGVRGNVEASLAAIDGLVGSRTKAQSWESRLAVLARWDRDYAPGELRVRRGGKRTSATQLTPSELAAISILCGNDPSVKNKPLTTRVAIDVEAKYVTRARQEMQRRRDRNAPIPRIYT
jgi:hypothetical protein